MMCLCMVYMYEYKPISKCTYAFFEYEYICMYVYVCMYVCMYVSVLCKYVCMYVRMYCVYLWYIGINTSL